MVWIIDNRCICYSSFIAVSEKVSSECEGSNGRVSTLKTELLYQSCTAIPKCVRVHVCVVIIIYGNCMPVPALSIFPKITHMVFSFDCAMGEYRKPLKGCTTIVISIGNEPYNLSTSNDCFPWACASVTDMQPAGWISFSCESWNHVINAGL